jgi:hypothetical protein
MPSHRLAASRLALAAARRRAPQQHVEQRGQKGAEPRGVRRRRRAVCQLGVQPRTRVL